jgi:hypothetical protein
MFLIEKKLKLIKLSLKIYAQYHSSKVIKNKMTQRYKRLLILIYYFRTSVISMRTLHIKDMVKEYQLSFSAPK